MVDDRKNETTHEEEDQTPTCSILPGDSTPSNFSISTTEDPAASPGSVRFTEELPCTSSDAPVASTSLSLTVVPPSKLVNIWKALIGEFRVCPAWLPSDWEQKAFTLHRTGDQLCLSYSSCDESSELQWTPGEETCTAECSLSRIPLEDLDWLQKRRVMQLCHQTKDDSIKVWMKQLL